MVRSILDTDLYKFTTSYAYMKLYPDAEGTFTFNDRDDTVYNEEFLKELRMELAKLSSLKMTPEEFNFCKTIRFIPECYWEWLRGFRFNTSKMEVSLDEDGHLHIIVTDKLYKATLYEVPILAIVSALRNKMLGNNILITDILGRLAPKIALSNQNQLKFSEFGTRRRFSYIVQDIVIDYIKNNSIYCTGTSNVHFAMKYGMNVMGTHPHEWFMFHGAVFGYQQANYLALEDWVSVYDGDLGIALTDTYGSEVFFRNFSRKHAKLFDGVRQDSGDEFKFVMQAIARYKELGVDPATKTIVFSNALTFPKALEIQQYCGNRIRCSFGIGTNLTNDTGYKPSNIVMKLTWCCINSNQKGRECVKLSDDAGKHTGSAEEINNCLNNVRERA